MSGGFHCIGVIGVGCDVKTQDHLKAIVMVPMHALKYRYQSFGLTAERDRFEPKCTSFCIAANGCFCVGATGLYSTATGLAVWQILAHDRVLFDCAWMGYQLADRLLPMFPGAMFTGGTGLGFGLFKNLIH